MIANSEDQASVRISRCFTSSHIEETPVGVRRGGEVEGASVAERAGEGVAVLVLQRGVRVGVDVEAERECEVG